jgi:hypothetical protein
MAVAFPEDPTSSSFLCNTLCGFAYVLRDRFRQQDLAEAAACVLRAIEVEAHIPAVVTDRQQRWQLLTTLAVIETSRGAPDAGQRWAEVDAILPSADPDMDNAVLNLFLEAETGIARWRLGAGQPAEAKARLDSVRACCTARPSSNKLMVEVEWLEASIAAANGDHEAAAAAADRILEVRTTWFARRRAGDCVHLAWRLLHDRPDADATVMASYRELAVTHYELVVRTLDPDIEQAPQDPWYVLPWGFCKLRLAELAAAVGETDAAKTLLAAALPCLEAVRSDAQIDQWDEPAFQAAVELRARLSD